MPRVLSCVWSISLLAGLACGPVKVSDAGTDTGEASSSEEGPSETSSDGVDTDTSTETETETGSDFVPDEDAPCSCACDQFAQDCPMGEKCVPYSSAGGGWDASKCVPVLGDQQAGEPCTYAGAVEATDDCDATSMCWDVVDVEGEGVGTCTPFCLGSADEPVCPDPPGCERTACYLGANGVLSVCVEVTCDPIEQDCSADQTCTWVENSGDFQCVGATMELPPGSACSAVNDCEAGSACIDAAFVPDCLGDSCCTPFCDLDAIADPCPELLPGTSCQVFEPPLLENQCEVGICRAS